MVPSFRRQLNQWVLDQHTDSILAGYLADGIEAMAWRWTRDYAITNTPPYTYEVDPEIEIKDKRPIILMSSIIYKSGNLDLASWRDGDFAYDPQQGRVNPILTDVAELDKLIPVTIKLAKASSAPLRGFNNVLNPESYAWLVGLGVLPGAVSLTTGG